MALPLWGQLEKSTDEPQTIEAAIAQAIVAHEQDPTAHLGEGESLSAHKHEVVIDHPAQSVVLDKIPFDYYEMFEGDLGSLGWSFEEGDGWVIDDRIVGASLFNQTYVLAVSDFPWEGGDDYVDDDLMFQFYLRVNGLQNSDGDFLFAMGVDPLFSSHTIRIERENDTLYVRFYENSSVVESYALGTEGNIEQYLRFYFDSAHERILVYRGYDTIITFETSEWKKWVPLAITVEMSRTTNTSMSFSMQSWKATYVKNLNI